MCLLQTSCLSSDFFISERLFRALRKKGLCSCKVSACDCCHCICYCHLSSKDPDQHIRVAKLSSFLLPPFPSHHLKSSEPVKLGGVGRLVGEARAAGLPNLSPHARRCAPVPTQTSRSLEREWREGCAGAGGSAEGGFL